MRCHAVQIMVIRETAHLSPSRCVSSRLPMARHVKLGASAARASQPSLLRDVYLIHSSLKQRMLPANIRASPFGAQVYI